MSGPLLAVVGDVHANFARLRRVLDRAHERDAAGVLLTGDLAEPTPIGGSRSLYLDNLSRVLGMARELGVPVAWVPGNHDLRDAPGEGNCDGRVLVVAGLRVHGIGGAGPMRFGLMYEWCDAEIRARPVLACDVLVSHAPPARTPLDWVPTARMHAGSEAIRERVERHVGVHVCGHCHESPGAKQLGGCLSVNVGAIGNRASSARLAFVEWDTGGAHRVVLEDLDAGTSRSWTRVPSEALAASVSA